MKEEELENTSIAAISPKAFCGEGSAYISERKRYYLEPESKQKKKKSMTWAYLFISVVCVVFLNVHLDGTGNFE